MTDHAPPAARRAPTRALDIVALAVVVGIATGWLQTVILLVTRYGFDQLVWITRDYAWMSPGMYALLFVALSMPLALLSLLWRSPRVYAVAAFALVTAAVFGLLLPYSQVGRVAACILAAGLGVQSARLLSGRTTRRLRGTALLLTVLVGAIAVLLPVGRRVGEQRATASLPASPADAPNVLLIILDTVRAASMSLYGNPRPTTPHLAQWAEQGATFDWAFSVGPWTLPSHASIFTGRYAGDLTTDWKVPLDRSDSTLAERFAARGYLTSGFVANMHYTSWDSGLNRGFVHYEDYQRSWGQFWRSTTYTQTALAGRLVRTRSVRGMASALLHPDLSIEPKHHFDRKLGDEVTRAFLDWHAAAPPSRPFFAFLNFFDSHQPYNAPRAFYKFDTGAFTSDQYEASVSYLDAMVDSVLGTLKRRGVLDNTVVIVTSDHGELFNEHRLFGHANSLYRNVLHVPLYLRFPNRVPVNRRVDREVSLRDLAATIADLAALPGPVPGQSLVPLTQGDSSARSRPSSPAFIEVTRAPNVDPGYPTASGPLTGLVDSALHYIRGPGAAEALYRYRTDATDTVDVARSGEGPALLTPLRVRVDSLLGTRRRTSPDAKGR